MATEDIDLTWKLLLAGWQTAYEPHALVGMEVPSSLRALWAQRKRWARGQGEVLHAHIGAVIRPRNPAAYWTISAAAPLRCQAIALARGPREQRVVWDIERQAVDAEVVAPPR